MSLCVQTSYFIRVPYANISGKLIEDIDLLKYALESTKEYV